MACVELPVAAYLLKPVVFTDLLPRVQTAVNRFRSWQAMQQAEERLSDMRNDYEHLRNPRHRHRPTGSTCSSRSRSET